MPSGRQTSVGPKKPCIRWRYYYSDHLFIYNASTTCSLVVHGMWRLSACSMTPYPQHRLCARSMQPPATRSDGPQAATLYAYHFFHSMRCKRKLTESKATRRHYKKLSYRRGTARCVVSIKILPIATQQCRNYSYDKS